MINFLWCGSSELVSCRHLYYIFEWISSCLFVEGTKTMLVHLREIKITIKRHVMEKSWVWIETNLHSDFTLCHYFTKGKGNNYWTAGSKEIRKESELANRQNKGPCGIVFRRKTVENVFCITDGMDIGFACFCFKLSLWKLMMPATDTNADGKEYTLHFIHWCSELLDAIRSSFRKIDGNKYSSQSTSLLSTKSDAAFIFVWLKIHT